MRTDAEIRARLAEIDSDERLHYPAASVQVNAPLALIQVNLETARDTLQWVLGVADSTAPTDTTSVRPAGR